MHVRQTKRERPTLKTAHEFFKEGSFGTDPAVHTLAGKAREDELGSGLIDHSQKMTAAAMQIAEK
jgi:hypothetical protein